MERNIIIKLDDLEFILCTKLNCECEDKFHLTDFNNSNIFRKKNIHVFVLCKYALEDDNNCDHRNKCCFPHLNDGGRKKLIEFLKYKKKVKKLESIQIESKIESVISKLSNILGITENNNYCSALTASYDFSLFSNIWIE